MLDKKRVQEAIKEAIALTEGTEEPYRGFAFREVFSELLHAAPTGVGVQEEEAVQAIAQKPAPKDRLAVMIRSDFDWGTLPIVNKNAITQNLMVLKLAYDKFKIDGLSARDVQQILFHKYRISKTPNAVSMSLMAAVGKYVDRIQEGKEFLYRITHKGIKRLEEDEDHSK